VDVADLIQLRVALEGDRVVDAALQEDHVLPIGEQMRHLLAAAFMVIHHGLRLVWQVWGSTAIDVRIVQRG
jgi:hypothetical protein